MQKTAKVIDTLSYIKSFPKETQNRLNELRDCIRKAAPEAEECISYNMPAYKQNGPLVYFAGYEKHIGFYPTGKGIADFQEELSAYPTSKGAVRFPIDKKLPLGLIAKIVKKRVKDNLMK